LLRYPPSRRFLASAHDPLWNFLTEGFAPYASFATGGLANGWGANALAYDEDDLSGWPVSCAEMDRAYRTAFARIPVAGPVTDDLSPYLAGVYPSQPPVRPSHADDILLKTYGRKSRALHRRGIRVGLARLAVVTDPDREDACDYCDRCLWGCPRGAIYNPAASTLSACAAHRNFRHLRGRYVISLLSRENRISAIRYLEMASGAIREEPCDAVFLAAGALQTGGIFLRTLKAARPDILAESEGLMDTTVIKIPFVSLRAIGHPAEPRAFQFNRLIVGIVGGAGGWPRYLHGELLHLTSLIYHPLIERMPFDSRTSSRLFFLLRSALGVVSLFFPDRIVAGNRQILVNQGERWENVRLAYHDVAEKEPYIARSLSAVRSGLRALGCVPRGQARSPSGAGIHYAGTVPMGQGPRRCGPDGRANLFSNLYIADGAAFPTLPSKSITLSLAAHAIRVAGGARL